MTLRRLRACREHLHLEPPAEWLLAGFFKYEPGKTGASLEDITVPESTLPEFEE